MHSTKSGRRLNFLITAGPTREYIDPVRFISNASSGKMGFELARAAQAAGHNVTLITTIRNSKYEIRNTKLRIITVETADEMFRTVKKHFSKCNCLIMAAAVADYTPFKTSRLKIRKSSRPITLKLKPTPDILKWAGQHKKVKSQKAKVKKQIVVGFALEDRNLRANAERKMREKHLNMVAANKPEAIGADKSTVWIKPANGNWTSITNKSKSTTAGTVIQLAENALHREKQ